MLKITEAPALIHAGLYHLELDGRQVGTVYAFTGCYDRIREALEEREATPEEGYLLEEQGREIATLVKRLANAELLIEKLKTEVGHWEEDFAMFDRAHEKAIDLWRKEHPDAGYTPDISDLNEWMVGRLEKAEAVKELLRSALRGINEIAEVWNMYEFKQIRDIAKFALRTAEDSSVVGLIDSTPAKQPEGMTKLDKALQNIAIAKRILAENSCPSEFGLKDCECDDSCCEDCWNCWNEEVGE